MYLYICSFLTHFHARWYQNIVHTQTNLQISAAGLFKYVCPFVTTGLERVKNCSHMIFSPLQIFFMILWSEEETDLFQMFEILLCY